MKDEMEKLLRNYEYMKLGSAISRGDKQGAVMSLNKLVKLAAGAEYTGMDMNFKNLKLCILKGDKQSAQNILAQIVAKRAKMLNEFNG